MAMAAKASRRSNRMVILSAPFASGISFGRMCCMVRRVVGVGWSDGELRGLMRMT